MATILTLATSIRFWLVTVIACLTLFGTVQTYRLNEAKDDLNKIRILTDEARKTSDDTIERLREAIPPMVEMARNNAVANYKARFGTCPVAGGIRAANGVLPNYDGETGRTQGTDAASTDTVVDPAIELAKQCAETTVMLNAFQDWARSNGLKEK